MNLSNTGHDFREKRKKRKNVHFNTLLNAFRFVQHHLALLFQFGDVTKKLMGNIFGKKKLKQIVFVTWRISTKHRWLQPSRVYCRFYYVMIIAIHFKKLSFARNIQCIVQFLFSPARKIQSFVNLKAQEQRVYESSKYQNGSRDSKPHFILALVNKICFALERPLQWQIVPQDGGNENDDETFFYSSFVPAKRKLPSQQLFISSPSLDCQGDWYSTRQHHERHDPRFSFDV